mmetsp:Transcript_23868/g.67610  ORF Transcript_23868/g.67610 Transcript_23868/m.67610 type:complete len:206 (+) Transcript_23868:192-809(+)
MYVPSVSYILSMRALSFVSTTLRLSFFVGVSSPASSEKFEGKIVNFWILKAAFGQHFPFLFAAVIAAVMMSIHTLSSIASLIFETLGFTREAPASKSSVPGTSPLAPTALSVTNATLYLRLSPTIMTSAMPSQPFFTSSSMGTGAIFSPPSPIISSLYRPVIFTMPCIVIMPLSPECSQPSLSMASAVFLFISATCSLPISGQAK